MYNETGYVPNEVELFLNHNAVIGSRPLPGRGQDLLLDDAQPGLFGHFGPFTWYRSKLQPEFRGLTPLASRCYLGFTRAEVSSVR
jgi:hypothetical protein